MDILSRMIAWEEGELHEDQVTELFQELVDSGVVWLLQGHYGRTAQSLIEAGLVTQKQVVAVVDEESSPPKVVGRFASVREAEDYIDGITDRDKVLRGGYGIDAQEG